MNVETILFYQEATTITNTWREILTGIYRFAITVGWQVQIIPTNATNAFIRETTARLKPVGCVVDCCEMRGLPLARLIGKLPAVLIDPNPRLASRRYPSLNHDSASLAEMAAEELMKTRFRTFTYLPAQTPGTWNVARERCFATAVARRGCRFVPWPGLAALRPLGGCGILCANDSVAKDVLLEATQLGFKVPTELAFIGIDNNEIICEHTTPSLTSILTDFQDAGFRAAQMLAERIANPHAPIRAESYGTKGIFRRESTRNLTNYDVRINRALAYIRMNACDPEIQTADIARVMGCSRSYADRRFQQVLGHTIREEILSLRLKKAYALLKTPNQTISSIPSLCGYRSDPFFKRHFKKATGLSMRDWRKDIAQSIGRQPSID